MSTEIERLEARVAALEARLAPPPRKETGGRYVDSCGIERDGRGNVVTEDDPNDERYRERMRAQVERAEIGYRSAQRRRTEGLPRGHFRDDCGLVRRADDGTVVAADELERTRA